MEQNERYDAQAVINGIFFVNYKEWTALLQNKKSIYVKDRESMNEGLKEVYEELVEYEIRSIFVFPVFDDHQMIGLIFIHNPDDEHIKGIEEIYEVLGNWLGYRLVKNDNRVQKTLSGLGDDYTAAYMINLDTDYFEIIINQKTNNAAKQRKELTFTQYLDRYSDKYVIEKDREAMKKEFQRELDQAYQTARKQLDIITSAIPGGIKISNDDSTYSFKYVSEQYAKMLGYDTVEEFMKVSGGTIIGIAHPDDVATGIAEALEQYKHGDSYEITYRMRCKDGSWKYIEDYGHKVKTKDGKIEHWNLILDKNELIEKTIELESEKKANEAKTTFLTRMSHDIRTPLNGIIGLLDIGEKHKEDHQLIDRNRKKAQVAADHLLSLINDILELNKLGDEEVVLNQEVVDVKKLLMEIKTITQMRGAENGIEIDVECSELKHPYVIGSPLHIKQIFINIITNAIKYNNPGGKVKCTVNEFERETGKVSYDVCIEDNGIGMHHDFVKNIFQPFTQESQDARSIYQGTGLGMSIVKNLVDRMGGTIKIESKVGVGTKVYISLSFEIADFTQTPEMMSGKAETKDLSGIKVLLAEDNELNREIAKFILEDEKMIVTEAKDGQEAVELFKNNKENTFDLILMDIMMPVVDGMEATRQIRNLDRADAKTIPIFAMTANAFVEDKEKAKKEGMNEHISKPLDVATLIDKIARYC